VRTMARELSEISVDERKRLVNRVGDVMTDEFDVTKRSIGEFWETLIIGMDCKNHA
jgi:hypothetical protein